MNTTDDLQVRTLGALCGVPVWSDPLGTTYTIPLDNDVRNTIDKWSRYSNVITLFNKSPKLEDLIGGCRTCWFDNNKLILAVGNLMYRPAAIGEERFFGLIYVENIDNILHITTLDHFDKGNPYEVDLTQYRRYNENAHR